MKKNNKKNNRKNINKDCCISDILQQMDAYDDFISYIGSVSKSIGLQCKTNRILDTNEGKKPEDILLKDLITQYNDTERIHYPKVYRGVFRSSEPNDEKKYIKRFRKDIMKAVNKRYACDYAYAGMDCEAVVSAVEDFFDLIL